MYHYVRNRNALTVISLHRVVGEQDPRWKTCDPLYTLSDRLFEQCIKFFIGHYSIISLNDLEKSISEGKNLPPNPLLITFDDGWADNFEYALPILRRYSIPAVLFVVAGAVDRKEAFFQERIIAAWRTGRLSCDHLLGIWRKLGRGAELPRNPEGEQEVRSLISQLQQLRPSERLKILADIEDSLDDEQRQMLTASELREIASSRISVGGHGFRHEPLTSLDDLDDELAESRKKLAEILLVDVASVYSMSLPFSKKSSRVLRKAEAAGFRLIFGGGLALTPVRTSVPQLVARVGVTASEVADARGDLMPENLANQLFRLPHKALQ